MHRLVVGGVLIALGLGCRGEAVDPVDPDAAPADTPDAASDGPACPQLADNLLVNASFELWEGASCVGWEGPVVSVEEAPFDCKRSGRVTITKYSGIRQSVDLAAPLGAGTELEITAAVRWVSGAIAEPMFDLEFEDSDGKTLGAIVPAVVTGYKADGEWHTVTSKVAAPGGATWMRFFIDSTGSGTQTLDFDRLVVRTAAK